MARLSKRKILLALLLVPIVDAILLTGLYLGYQTGEAFTSYVISELLTQNYSKSNMALGFFGALLMMSILFFLIFANIKKRAS